MNGDPVARFIEKVHGEMPTIPLWMREGKVVSRDPLSITVAELPAQKTGLKLDKRLKEALANELSAGVEKTLARGSTVLMLTQDDQTFYIICEVVKA